jgi:hypothetical protein
LRPTTAAALKVSINFQPRDNARFWALLFTVLVNTRRPSPCRIVFNARNMRCADLEISGGPGFELISKAWDHLATALAT